MNTIKQQVVDDFSKLSRLQFKKIGNAIVLILVNEKLLGKCFNSDSLGTDFHEDFMLKLVEQPQFDI